MKKVKIVRAQGFAPGEEVSLPDNRAMTYARNGQAKPVGWSLSDDKKKQSEKKTSVTAPVNRMLDTSKSGKSTED